MTTKAIKLGHKVREITTGIEGLTVTRTEFLTGNVQFGIQIMAKEGDGGGVYEPVSHDLQQLDYIDEGIAARVTPASSGDSITLGEKVRDIITKFVGIATRRVIFMNGCVYYFVQAEMDKEGKSTEQFLEFKRLEVVGAGVTAAIAAKANPVSVKPVGGPSTRTMQRG
jgi:hypothetical protein